MKRTEYGCHKCGVESHVDYHEWMEEEPRSIMKVIIDDHCKWAPECDEPNFYVIGTIDEF